MEALFQDLRYALRTLARNPGFSIAAILTLALGIGANTAIFSVVDGVLLRPAPFDDMDRLVMVWETDSKSGTTREPASVPDYLDLKARGVGFSSLAAFAGTDLSLTPARGEPTRVAALAVSHEFLPMVGIRPLLGRTFDEAEDRPGRPAVAVIGEDLWSRLYARDPGVLGQTLRLNEAPVTIVGVLPRSADFGTLQVLGAAAYGQSFAARGGRVAVDVWVPLRPDPLQTPRTTHPIFVLGRLAPDVSAAAAQGDVASIMEDLEATYPENDARGANVEPLGEVVFGPVRPALYALFGAVALVLLVACVNVANLLLARGTARAQEVAVRAALGAGLRPMARLFLVESVVLTVLGAGLGVGLATVGLDLLLAAAPADIPRLEAVRVDGRVLGITLLVTAAVAIGFGVLPTLQTFRPNLQGSLQGTGGRGGTSGRGQGRIRAALVVTELALAVMLLTGAGLLIRSLGQLQLVDPGFETAGVLKAEYQLPASRYPRDFAVWPAWTEIHRFHDQLARQIAALPGVEAVAFAGEHPVNAGFQNSFLVVGREAEARDWPEIGTRRVSPGYRAAVGTPLLEGRFIEPSDDAGSAPVLLINQTARRMFFQNQALLGQQIRLWGQNRTIVGVVGDEHFRGLAAAAAPAVYLPVAQAPSAGGAYSVLVLVEGDPGAFAPSLRAAIRAVDPGLAVFALEPLAQTLAGTIGKQRFTMLVLGAFAAAALLLTAIGVYGVLSYAVAQRRREIGIRIALGADVRTVRRLVLSQGALLAVAGLGLGLLGALGATRVLSTLLYGVSTTDTVTFGGAAVVLGLVALLSSVQPAMRAARVDPVVALRSD